MTAPLFPARIAEFRSWIEHWRGGGPSADAIARGFEELLEEREILRTIALKGFTVVEWVVGEGKMLQPPHFDADDLLLEMADVLGVDDSAKARAALGDKP